MEAVSTEGGARRRRTQAERRAATRAALLEACVDCLLEYGYTKLTTSAVVSRARVSRGAQAHYFSTKAELVVASLRHLTDRLAAEVAEQPEASRGSSGRDDPGADRGALLDLLWAVHTDRVFPALMELWTAARTDDELRVALSEFERELTREIVAYCQHRLPELAEHPDFRSLLATVLAALRGLALVDFLGRTGELQRLWPGVRGQLLRLMERNV
jgi:AcrR family transcriptional regulator